MYDTRWVMVGIKWCSSAGLVPVPLSCSPVLRSVSSICSGSKGKSARQGGAKGETSPLRFVLRAVDQAADAIQPVGNGASGEWPSGKSFCAPGGGMGWFGFIADLTICSPCRRPCHLPSHDGGGLFTWLGGGSVGTSFHFPPCVSLYGLLWIA